MTRTLPYWVWLTMKQRCLNPNNKQFADYGGRGISVCSDWAKSFVSFWRDMGPSYKHGLTLDRTDNDGDYCPENCRWITQQKQAYNTRKNRKIKTPRGWMFLKQASVAFGIPITTLHKRIRYKWYFRDVFSPANPSRKRKPKGCPKMAYYPSDIKSKL